MTRALATPVVCTRCGVSFKAPASRIAVAAHLYCSQACYHAVARTHGETSGERSTEYIIWQGLKRRCLNPKLREYPNYGGRGIQVCQRWLDGFENFLADVGRRPSPKHSLDRIDGDGNYEPGNVRWATANVQQRNRRNNRLLTLDGVTRCATEWAEIFGIGQSLIGQRLRKGWSDERTLTTPVVQRSPTHCMRGHLYTAESTKVHRTTGNRQCRICIKLWRARAALAAKQRPLADGGAAHLAVKRAAGEWPASGDLERQAANARLYAEIWGREE